MIPSIPVARFRPRREPRSRDDGIALLLVMIVFVVLYMVVYQLHFSTRMEETIAQVRYGEVESALALHSVGLYVQTVLMEDIKQDLSEANAAGAMPGMAPGGAAGAPGQAPGGAGGSPPGGGGFALAGNMAAGGVPGAGAGGTAPTWHDYPRENIFLENTQTLGNVTVKIRTFDGESRFDPNHIFDYPRLSEDELLEGEVGITEDDLASAAAGRSAEEAEASLRDRILSQSRAARAGGTQGDDDEARDDLREDATGATAARLDELDTYDPEPPLLEPVPSRVRAAEEMLRRAILLMFTLNEDNGYEYSQKYFAEGIATEIISYILDRRMQETNNRILMVSEFLQLDGVTPEVYYGPVPDLPDGEQLTLGDFTVARDEYGDLQANYIYDEYGDLDEDYLEDTRLEMEGLMQEFGRYADFPLSAGFDRLQSSGLTRGMKDLPVEIDENGEEFVIVPPLPIGLRDLFTTHSTGKINLNTASAPVLFGLLLSLTEEEANQVALEIEDYRNRFQEIEDTEGIDRVDGATTPDLGQPRRQPPPEEDDEEALLMEDEFGGYQDLETNYFTNLQQIELIDGSDGGPDDLLRSDQGVERVATEDDTLYRRVMFDLEKVVVFGSTYFDVTMKAKTQQSRAVKSARLTLKRDVEKRMMEVVMWKALER